MWHDFEMSSEGCGAAHALGEGLSAYKLGARFLAQSGAGCHVECDNATACSGVAAVRWHSHYNSLPPVIGVDDCPGSYV